MTNIVLGNISSFVNDSTAVTQYNANNALITTAFSDALSKTGEAPNTMSAVLDMNNYNIVNLPSPATINSPVRLVDVINPSVALTVPPVGTSGSTVPLLNGVNTWSGTQNFSTTANFQVPITVNNTSTTFGTGAITSNLTTPGAQGFYLQQASTGGTFGIGTALNFLVCVESMTASPTSSFLTPWSFIHDVNGGNGGRSSLVVTTTLASSSTWSGVVGSTNAFVVPILSSMVVAMNAGSASFVTPAGQYFGFNAQVILQSGATFASDAVGAEIDCEIFAGASVNHATCLRLAMGNAVRANTIETMLEFVSYSTVPGTLGCTNIIAIGAIAGGGSPVRGDGGSTILTTVGMSTNTIANGIDLSGVNVISGFAFKSPNFFVTGGGVISSGAIVANGAIAGTSTVTAKSTTSTPSGGAGALSYTMGNAGTAIYYGAGAPSGVLTAAQGSIYIRTDGGASTGLYLNKDGGTTWGAVTSS